MPNKRVHEHVLISIYSIIRRTYRVQRFIRGHYERYAMYTIRTMMTIVPSNTTKMDVLRSREETGRKYIRIYILSHLLTYSLQRYVQ